MTTQQDAPRVTSTADQSVTAIRLAVQLIEETARDAGPMGMPGSLIYLAMADHGMTLNTYTAILQTMVEAGRITVVNDCVRVAR